MDENDLFKDLFIKLGDLEIKIDPLKFKEIETEFPNSIPRTPEAIKRDISRAKNIFETNTLNRELNNSYKYYNSLSIETKEKIEREKRLTNKVHNMLKDEKEFLTEEEYDIAFKQEYNILKDNIK